MSYLEKVERCNHRDLTRFVPFIAADTQIGWLTRERAAALAAFAHEFVPLAGGIALHPALATAKQRTAAVRAVAPALIATGLFPTFRDELYAVRNRWSDPEILRMDRGFVPAFGVRAYGVHINGFVRKRSGIHLWIGTRAKDRQIEPGKLDNMVAGGQPAGLSLAKNVIKECREEAHLGARRAAQAKPVGVISYCCARDGGLRTDTLFCYDLEMKATEVPRPSEEIVKYELMPVAQVLKWVRTTDRFKFNVNLVIIDFAVRHGLITPETEPHFETIVAGLHEYPQPIV